MTTGVAMRLVMRMNAVFRTHTGMNASFLWDGGSVRVDLITIRAGWGQDVFLWGQGS